MYFTFQFFIFPSISLNLNILILPAFVAYYCTGFWESVVRRSKSLLSRLVNNVSLTYEQIIPFSHWWSKGLHSLNLWSFLNRWRTKGCSRATIRKQIQLLTQHFCSHCIGLVIICIRCSSSSNGRLKPGCANI